MSQEMETRPELTQGFGWRVGASILTVFGATIALIIWLFFYAESFTVYQNIAIAVVGLLTFTAVMGAMWAPWGIRHSNKR